MKRRTVALVAFAGIVGVPTPAFAAVAPTTAPASAVRLTTLAPRVPAGATRLGQLHSGQPVTITVALRPSNADALNSLLSDLYNPASPRYEQWLAAGAFAREFGPSEAEVNDVTSWLHAQGLRDTAVEGMAVRATGDEQTVAHALGVSFSQYRLAAGSTAYVASGAPLLPRNLVGAVTTIVGLSNTLHFDNALDLTPHKIAPGLASGAAAAAARAAAASPRAAPAACKNAKNYANASYWTADQIGRFYRINNLFAAGLTGKGKTIALLELGKSRAADTNNYLACFGLHNTVKVEHVDGGADTSVNGTLEAEIDIQEAATQAPGASIISYEAPNDATGEYDAYNKIVSNDKAEVVSTSWGKCEAALQAEPNGGVFINALHTLFQQAAAQGQSVFSATGDTGSEDCYDGTTTAPSETLQVDNPADDPFVTAIGGTSLEEPGVEPVWNDCGGFSNDSCAAGGGDAGGGGQSTVFDRPSWQKLAAGATCPTCREVPDISANAGVSETFYDSDAGPGADPPPDDWTAVGGTSIGAPLMAGLAADIDQGCKSARIGDFAPKLAALAAKHVYGSALTDVTTGIDWTNFSIRTPGTNDLTHNHAGTFKTSAGYDLASGLGVPIATGLACPRVTSITPSHGKVGTRVTLHGVGLEKATIKFGSAVAKVLSSAGQSAVVVVPKGNGVANVGGSNSIGAGNKTTLFAYPGSDTGSYRTAASDGSIFNFGGALAYGAPNPKSLHAPIVGMAVDHATGGYWLVAADGNVYNFNAAFLGDAGGGALNQPIVGIASTADGGGYWLVARDGGIFAFGNAHFYGSTGGRHLNRPIVGIAADPRTGGYWLVASDGGIFAFQAPYAGSTGGIHLNRPIVGMAADTATGGYWLVASDGGVFAFNAPFYGSTGALDLNRPIVGIAATGDAGGYRFVASDGGVFNFGDARFSGSTGGSGGGKPVVAVTPAE